MHHTFKSRLHCTLLLNYGTDGSISKALLFGIKHQRNKHRTFKNESHVHVYM